MKLLVKKILEFLAFLFSHIYTFRLNKWLNEKTNYLYTSWISNFLGMVGDNTRILRPLKLQGGGQHRIRIGSDTFLEAHCVLGCWESYQESHYEPEIVIGNQCNIGEYCHITAIDRITIGDGLLTGRFVYIGDNAHGGLSWEEANTPPAQRLLSSKGPIKIGRNVWIGDKVSIMGGITIGDNVIIGAGSIVTHDVPSNSMAAGMPARVVKSLKDRNGVLEKY